MSGVKSDLAACSAILRQGSKSFHAASLLMPARYRQPAMALYAFCRLADDAADGEGSDRGSVDAMRRRLDLAYAQAPIDHPVDRAFALAVHAHAIPRALPEALFEGFAWDLGRRRYRDLAELEAYAARVAGSVGIMLSLVMGRRDPQVLARAADLGLAMQLTNIARDVGEDARSGRLYLPEDWLADAGIDPDAFLAKPRFSPALAQVKARLLDVANAAYARASVGIDALPFTVRPAIHAARLIYAEIGHEVARRGYDSISSRATSSSGRKLALLGEACLATIRMPQVASGSSTLATAHLIAAAVAVPVPAPALPSVTAKALWLIDLFERLELADRDSQPDMMRRMTLG
jgi:phytoene synthase